MSINNVHIFQHLHINDTTRCVQCPNGTLPDPGGALECVDMPEEYLTLGSNWAILAISFAVFGIAVTSAVLVVFIRHNDTPVVRASGRELCYVLLVGLLLCYAITFVLMVRHIFISEGSCLFLLALVKKPYITPSSYSNTKRQ